jgi:hypothetical protein
MKFKAATDLSGYSGDALITAAQTIHDDTSLVIAIPKIPLTMVELQALIDTCDAALVKKTSKATADTATFNVTRIALEEGLSGISGCVNDVAKGDEMIIISTGFPFTRRHGRPITPLPQRRATSSCARAT